MQPNQTQHNVNFITYPDNSICIRVHQPLLATIIGYLISFPFYQAPAAIISVAIEHFHGPEWIAGPLAIAGIAAWLRKNYQGTQVIMDPERTTIRIWNSNSYARFKKTEPFLIKTSQSAKRWRGELHQNSVLIANTAFFNTNDEAADAIQEFAEQIGISDLKHAETVTQTDKDNKQQQYDDPEAIRSKNLPALAPPLILLVHGTFASNSEWTFPEKSEVVASLKSKYGLNNVEYSRFQWSGENNQRAREDASSALSERLASELKEHPRHIFIIAHSHGGNVALSAWQHLTKHDKRFVRLVTLSTPFIDYVQDLGFYKAYETLPVILKDNIGVFLGAFFWIASYVCLSLIHIALSNGGRTGLFSGSASPFHAAIWLAIFLSPFAMFWYFTVLWKRFLKTNLSNDSLSSSTRLKLRIITHAQDEAYQALSVVANIISLVQFATLSLLKLTGQLISRTKLLELTVGGFFVLLTLSLVGLGFLFGLALLFRNTKIFHGSNLLDDFQWPDSISWFVDTSFRIMEVTTVLFMSSIIVVGAIFCFIVLIVLILGIIKLSIYKTIGVLSTIGSLDDFLEAIFGMATITQTPTGFKPSIRVLERSGDFNHTSIYTDDKAIKEIASFVKNENGFSQNI